MLSFNSENSFFVGMGQTIVLTIKIYLEHKWFVYIWKTDVLLQACIHGSPLACNIN